MANRKQRKAGAKSQNPPTQPRSKAKAAEDIQAPPPVGSAVNASMLLDELQQRCDSLRQWQRQTSEDLSARKARALEHEQNLAQDQDRLERDRARFELDQDALKRARLMLEKEQAQVEQTQQALEDERRFLERSGAELDDHKQILSEMRVQMDEEWASMGQTRLAQESLAAALDTERLRIQDQGPSARLGGVDEPADISEQGSGPGLSLSQAA